MANLPQPRVEAFEYLDGESVCEGHIAFDASTSARRPCVLVAHAWDGLNDAIRVKTAELALLGYVGFALDVYGKGVRGSPSSDNSHLMSPFMKDRALLRRRLNAALAAAKRHHLTDPDRMAAIGYCFGGLCVLDLARSVPSGLRAVVSFHGLLRPPQLGPQAPITAKVLILHGWQDPMAPPADVWAITRELTDAGADWQLHAYGHAMHAFSNPGANSAQSGILYNAAADLRSWVAMRNFLGEALADTTTEAEPSVAQD